MVSQADRQLIHNFVTELLPYIETVDKGVHEFAQPSRDGVVVGQAIQALGMIKGAGSILMVDGLVTISDFIARAFELVQTNDVLAPGEAYQRLLGLKAALDDFLTAIESEMDPTSIVTRARTIFESIPTHTGALPGTTSLRDRASLDALFAERVSHAREHTARLAADDATISALEANAAERQIDEHDTREIVLPLDMLGVGASPTARQPLYPMNERTSQPPARILPPVPEPASEVDPELREIFAEEAAELIISFGENAKVVATSPSSVEDLARLRRDAHTIKGAANMTGFPIIGQLGGAVERLLDEHLDSRMPVGRETLELLLVSWKMLRAMLARLDDLALFRTPSNSTVQRAEQLRQSVAAQAAARRVARSATSGPLSDEDQPVGYDYMTPIAPVDEPAPITEKLVAQVVPQTAYFESTPDEADVITESSSALDEAARASAPEDVLVASELDVIVEPYDETPEIGPDDVLVEPGNDLLLDTPFAMADVDLGLMPADEESLVPDVEALAPEVPAGDALLESRPAPGAFEWRYVERFALDPAQQAENGTGSLESSGASADITDFADEDIFLDAAVLEEAEPVGELLDALGEYALETDLALDEVDDAFLSDVDAMLADEPLADELFAELEVEAPLDAVTPGDDAEAGPPAWEALDAGDDVLEPFPAEEPSDPAHEPSWDEVVLVTPLSVEDDHAPLASLPDAEHDALIETHDAELDLVAAAGAALEFVELPVIDKLQSDPEAAFDVASFQTPDWLERPKGSTGLLNPSSIEDVTTGEAGFAVEAMVDSGTGGLELGAEPGLLGSALLDLAFAAEVARRDAAVSEPADITILDQHRESELALEMFETFAVECAEHLDALNRAAMQLDREPGALEPLRQIKRALHTLKGASAAADLPELSERCHQLEDSLAAIELSGQEPGREFASELFSAVEQIEGELLARRGELRGDATTDAVGQVELGAAEATTLRVDLTRVDGLLNTVGELVVNRAGLEQRLERLSGSLEELSLTASRLQTTSQQLEREAHGGRMFGRTAREPRALDATRYAVHERMPGWDSLEFDRYTEFDRLIRQLTEVGADITAAVNEITQLRGDLETVSTRQRRLTTTMQDELMGIRMVPLASLAPRLYRVVRRVSGDRGKEVRLILEGGDTPFDKTVLDALHEPLLHLLRNAVDHGIEAPEERRLAGKPELGTIRIRAYRDGSEAVIDVIDDGAGIDHEQVLERARALNLAGEGDLGRSDALRLIFLPGFSTRVAADEVSGRGVGLDIVESVVARFKGRLAVDSATDRGTIFSLRLPVMLAVTQAFMVTAGGERYAIPIANIESVADRDDQRFSQFGDAIVMELGDNAIPVIDLSTRLGRPDVPMLEREGGWILVAQVGERRWALYVDELEGQQEIVVKPLGRFLRNTPGLLGATILGNGDVALIADVPRLLGVGQQRTELEAELSGDASLPGEEVGEGRRARVALVVDDSLSVRRVVGRTLERHGWVTILARDGVEALELLEGGDADVIVTDIEMPRMDGFELLSSIRARPAIAQTPVVVLTSRSSDKHRGRAFELGADAYLVKPFQEQELIETVTRAARVVPANAAA